MFYSIGERLYSAFTNEAPVITVPAEYKSIAEAVVNKIGWHTKVTGTAIDYTVGPIKENNEVMVALSGGLDSVYLMRRLIDKGYTVTAVHVAGLNKSSAAVEEEAARRSALQAGAKYVRAVFKAPRQTFPDNPFKNQLVLSILLDIGVKRGIYRYAVGSDWTTPLKDAVVGYTVTDSAEVNREFWNGIKARFPQAELIFIPDGDKKYDRLAYLYKVGALDNVSSCISPLRFREHLHKQNERKYGIKLMPGRCGSCYKCAMEYLLLTEAGLIPRDEQFAGHCWHTLATSKTAHRPDLFREDMPVEKRLANLMNYGS